MPFEDLSLSSGRKCETGFERAELARSKHRRFIPSSDCQALTVTLTAIGGVDWIVGSHMVRLQ
jgi:hypothetical protein